jgi:hypothetical protein
MEGSTRHLDHPALGGMGPLREKKRRLA